MNDEEFFKAEVDEIHRGHVVKFSQTALQVRALRYVMRVADDKNITGIEIFDLGTPAPVRISVRQLRPFIEETLAAAKDSDPIDLSFLRPPGSPIH